MTRFLLTLLLCSGLQLFGQEVDSLQQVIKTSEDLVAKADAFKSILIKLRSTDTIRFKQYLAEGLTFAREHNDKETEFTLARIDCRRLYSNGEYRKMIAKVDSLLPLAKRHGLKEIQIDLLNYSGNAYSNLSDYTNAAVQFIEYLSIAMELPDNTRAVAMANNNIGMAFLNMKSFNQAIQYLDRSLEGQEHFDSAFKAHTYWNLGICYMEQKQYEKALKIFELGVKEADRKGDGYAAAGNQLCIGSIYVRQDRFEEGIVAYEKAFNMSTQAQLEPYKIIEALNGLIYANNQLGRPEQANRYIALADSITNHHKLSDLRNREFLLYKASNLLLLGKPQEADLVFNRYSQAVDSLHNEENLRIIQEKETEFRTKEKEQQLVLQQSKLDFQQLLNLLLGIGALVIVLVGFLIYRQQRLKIKHQKQEQELQEALQTVETNRKLEDQRQRIAKELHDNIGSQLTYLASAAHNIGAGMKLVSEDITQNKLEELSNFSQEAITDLRDTIWVMNRSVITWEDLAERIRYLAHKVSNTTGILVNVTTEGQDKTPLNPTQTMDIYRIIQESVNNAVKHSKANQIDIVLKIDGEALVEVKDNGMGFNTTEVTTSSDGLRNMKARAGKLGAKLSLESNKNGTSVTLKIPELPT